MTIRYKEPYEPIHLGVPWYVTKAYRDAHNNVWLPMAYECFGGVWRCTEDE